jgi:Flagellar hook capping protein
MASISNNILGEYEANLKAQANVDRVATDKNTFLKLLVAQLTHQDPLNPVEDKEFIAQLAQFTSVEELQNLNKGMQELNEAYLRQQTTNAASFIGMQVEAKGDVVSIANIGSEDEKNPATSSPFYFELQGASSGGRWDVYTIGPDGLPYGPAIYTKELGPMNAGRQGDQWSGMTNDGKPCPDGQYIVVVSVVNENGKGMLVDTSTAGLIIGVETATDGNHKLTLSDGRQVYYNDVEYITDPRLFATDNGNGGDGDGGGDGSSGNDNEEGKEEGEGSGEGTGTET